MKIIHYREQDVISVKSFSDAINEKKDFERVLELLLKCNSIRYVNKDTNWELEDLLSPDGIVVESVEADAFYFKCVGILLINNVCIVVYPKYIKCIEEDYKIALHSRYKKMKEILKVIDKFQKVQQNIGNTKEEINSFNFLGYIKKVFEHYHQHGVYRNQKNEILLNEDGNILWEKTINEVEAFIQDDRPVYIDFYVNKSNDDILNICTKIHRSILCECSNYIQNIGVVLGIESIDIYDVAIEDIGSIDYLIRCVKQELKVQFVTFKIEQLNLMLEYLERKAKHTMEDPISFYGTNNFYVIWEGVCAAALDNSLPKTLNELGLTMRNIPGLHVTGKTLLKEIIEKTQWHIHNSDIIYLAPKTLIPDIVVIKDGKLSIYDAKYYRIRLNETEAVNCPGVGDVTKQFLYEKAYANLIKNNGLVLEENAFLFPSDENNDEELGSVTFPILNEKDGYLGRIRLIRKSATQVFKMFLKQR